MPSAPPIQTRLPFWVCYPHFPRTPERLAHIQLKPLFSSLSLSPNSNVIISVQATPCLTIQLCLLISPPCHPFPNSSLSLPLSTMPQGFKAWAPRDLGTTHCYKGPRPTSLFTIGAWGSWRRGGRWRWAVGKESGEHCCSLIGGVEVKRTPRAEGQSFKIGFVNV